MVGAEEVPIETNAFEEANDLCNNVDDASGTTPQVHVERSLLRPF